MDLTDNRPDPDELLASLNDEEKKSKRGKLKIFFGMCAGVGKTYNMLKAAQTEKMKVCDIIIGYVETHNRIETAELVEGFEVIPRKTYEYKSTTVHEMDLDAIIARKPKIVLVDELAHTNAPGSRHTKRYQDVQEILEQGINVYTTLNVQHLESRSDTVAQITGIIIRETLPDEIFETADEVELIDLPPEELLQRLSEGKVYTPERSREAIENFFRKGNITALREMALRIVADRVDKQLHDYMQKKHIRGPWKSGLHLLVAINYHQQSTRLMRWAKNLSYSMGANIQAIYVETLHKLTPKEREQLDKNFNLAKQLGIKFRIITNYDIVKAIVDFANKENVTHIIVGKPRVRNLLTMFRLGNFVNRLIQYSGNIDVYVLGSDSHAKDRFSHRFSFLSFTSNIRQYLFTLLLVFLSSVACYLVKDFVGYQVISFVLLFLVSLLALFYGRGPILLSATSSALIWDYFFIPPQFTLHIGKPEDMLMLIMFFIIALLNGILTSRVRGQEKKIRIREERTDALYQLTKELSMTSGINDVTKTAQKYIQKYFNLDCAIILKNNLNQLDKQIQNDTKIVLSENELSIAAWVYKHSIKAGKRTDTLPSTDFTFYPLTGINENIGVIAVEHVNIFTQGEEQFWEAFISQISGKFEREFLRNTAQKAYLLNESDKLYKTLFNSLSHELRTPISTIIGAVDTLKENKEKLSIDNQVELLSEIDKASIRLNRNVENLLNMSRLESGTLKLNLDWCDVNELIYSVIQKIPNANSKHKIVFEAIESMPLFKLDSGLMEQILYNIIQNAVLYTPENSLITVNASLRSENCFITITDNGKGFPENEIQFVFDKFYRLPYTKTGGTGLGLSIAKGFTEAHKGKIELENVKTGGAKLSISIPAETSFINNLKNE